MGVVYLMFFFNDTAATEIYTLSLHDALPISLADAQAALAAHDHAVGGRAQQPRESAFGLHARHDRVEGLAHALAEHHGGRDLSHPPLDAPRGRLHLVAVRRNPLQLLARVGRGLAGSDRLQAALRDQIGEAPVWRGRVRVVVHGQTEVPLLVDRKSVV